MILATFSVGDHNCTLSSLNPKDAKTGKPSVETTYELWIMDGVTGKEWKKAISGENSAYMQFAALMVLDDVSEIIHAANMLRNDASLQSSGFVP